LLASILGLALLGPPAFAGKEFVADEADFTCIRDWSKVRNIRVFNAKPRRLKKALKILEREKLGRKLPKGTILQLVPNEAMVKRGGKFNPEGDGWEFFALGVSAAGTTIITRGGPEAVSQFGGGSCQGCHAAAADFDFVCEKSHGCIELPDFLTDEVFQALQESDVRCPPAAP
jgi:hypothetical protein